MKKLLHELYDTIGMSLTRVLLYIIVIHACIIFVYMYTYIQTLVRTYCMYVVYTYVHTYVHTEYS